MTTATMLNKFAYWINGKLYLAVARAKWSKTLVELKGPSFRFDPRSGFYDLAKDEEPSAEDLFQIVDDGFEQGLIGVDSMQADAITFAGDGEPLARLETILESAASIKESRHGVPMRIITSGLVPSRESFDMTTSLKQAGIKELSISLMADNPKLFNELVQPQNKCTFNDVCAFISVGVEAGLRVTCTAVERPEVNLSAVRSLALSLGASNFKSYKFHP